MKTKSGYLTALLLFGLTVGWAQNTKIYKTTFGGADKKVMIISGNKSLKVEGYSGNDVVVEVDGDLPEAADGLKIVSAGAVDNTGIGANVVVEGSTMKIKIPRSKYFGNFKVKIPKEVAVNISEKGDVFGGNWDISGLDGEVEIKTTYSVINITDVSGPIIARAGWGKISVVFDKVNPTKPSSISSSGIVDVTLPADTKANLKLQSQFGDIFTDFDIVQTKKASEADEDDEKSAPEKLQDMQSKTYEDQKKVAKDQKKMQEDITSANGAVIYKNGLTPRPATAPRAYTNKSAVQAGAWSSDNKNDDEDDCNCWDSGNGMNGTINGGGVSIKLHSDHQNIFLRKKK